MLLYKKKSKNPAADSQDFIFSCKFFFKSFSAFGFLLQYQDYENYDEILVEKTEFSNNIHFISVRNGEILKRTSSKICSGRTQAIKERCTDLPFNHLHNITVIYYGSNTIIKLNNNEVGVYESIGLSAEKLRKKTFGLISHTGSSALFKEIKIERISIPEEVQLMLFGRKVESLSKEKRESPEITGNTMRFKENNEGLSCNLFFVFFFSFKK